MTSAAGARVASTGKRASTMKRPLSFAIPIGIVLCASSFVH